MVKIQFKVNHSYADSSSQKPVDDIYNFYAIVISEWKTILCEQVIGLDNIVEVSGADFNEHTDFWATIAAKVGLPYMGEITTERSAAEGNNEARDSKSEKYILSKDKIIQYYIEKGKVLVIDDFHYASPEMQMKMAQ